MTGTGGFVFPKSNGYLNQSFPGVEKRGDKGGGKRGKGVGEGA